MAGARASVDRISHLPPDVTDCILRFLSLNDAVKISTLSTYWRYKWALLPQLILGSHVFSQIQKSRCICENSGENCGLETSRDTLEFSELVNYILLFHVGPIHKFFLHIPYGFPEDANMGQWIQYVSGKSVKEFTLFLCDDLEDLINQRKLPSCMFSCVGFNDLTHLTLIGFNSLSMPSTFRGFPFLISLKVSMFGSTGEAYKLESLVSKCPQLESLDLTLQEKESSLTINAPKLENLVLNGYLSSVHLQETTKIKTVSLIISSFHTENTLIMFFRCLSNIEKLVLDWRFWMANCGLSNFELPENLKHLTEFRKLKYLELNGVELFVKPPLVSFILGLLQMAPMLLKLEIKVWGGVEISVLENCHMNMAHLRSAMVIGNSISIRLALQLTRLILSSSPALEIMIFQSHNLEDEENLMIAKELLRYRRASANVDIVFKT